MNILKVIVNSLPWFFSGIGVFVLGLFIKKRDNKKKSQNQITKNHSTAYQAGHDIKIDKVDKKNG